MYSFSRAAITKYHKIGGLNSRSLLSHSSRSQSLRSRSQQGHVPSKKQARIYSRHLSQTVVSLAFFVLYLAIIMCISSYHLPVYACLSLCLNFPFLQGHSSYWTRTHSYDLIFHLRSLQCRRLGFNPWVGNIPWRREELPTPVFLPGKFHGQKSLAGYSPWRRKKSDMTK